MAIGHYLKMVRYQQNTLKISWFQHIRFMNILWPGPMLKAPPIGRGYRGTFDIGGRNLRRFLEKLSDTLLEPPYGVLER